MINEKSLKNWLALTKEGKYITIDKVDSNKQDYYCPCCQEVLRGRALESNLIQPHFYHLQNDNLNSCNYENAYRRYWKDNLILLAEVIELPILKTITCIDLKINYKVNDILTADIYIKTDQGQQVLFLFDKSNIDFLKYDYDIFYIDFLQLEFNKSNFNSCIEILHSAKVKSLIENFKNDIAKIKQKIDISFKEDATEVNVNINNILNVKNELIQNRFYKEAELIEDVLMLINNRLHKFYTYKKQNIYEDEYIKLNNLIDKILNTKNSNLNTDIGAFKKIDYNIYKGTKWNRFIYFDFIKPISDLIKGLINQLELI